MHPSVTDSYFRWIQQWDTELKQQNHHIALTLDNFAGHHIQYKPEYIKLIYFQPGLTSRIQPLDAGIIHCFKAHYRLKRCLRAIERDKAGEEDIFKGNVLEAMTMATRAWESVSRATLKDCWDRTGILQPRLPKTTPSHSCPSMPATLADIDASHNKWAPNIPSELCEVATIPNERSKVEEELLGLLAQLKERGRISESFTLDQFLDPEEEREIGESLYSFEGGYDEIVGMVQEMGLERGDIIEKGESGDGPDDENVSGF